MGRNKRKKRGELFKAISQISQIAFIIIACVLVGVFMGSALDRFFTTGPWLTLVFSLLGMAAAFKSLYDYSKKMYK
jgi:ATP synthase protein I